jgi:YD repeat-containing protein
VKTVSIDWLAKTAAYNYDDAGRLTDLTSFNGAYSQYGYDNANRLTALSNLTSRSGSAIAVYAFTLDANGNRTGATQTVPLGLPLATTSTTAYAYNTQKNRLLQAGSTIYRSEKFPQ